MSMLSISKQDTLNSASGEKLRRVKQAIKILSALKKDDVYFPPCKKDSRWKQIYKR